MPGVTGSGSGHTIGVETGHTSVTGYGNRAYMCIPHEYIVVGSSSLSESVSSSFIAQHRHACSAMLIATSNHANTHPAESTSHRARNTSPHTHSSPAIVGFSTDNLKGAPRKDEPGRHKLAQLTRDAEDLLLAEAERGKRRAESREQKVGRQLLYW